MSLLHLNRYEPVAIYARALDSLLRMAEDWRTAAEIPARNLPDAASDTVGSSYSRGKVHEARDLARELHQRVSDTISYVAAAAVSSGDTPRAGDRVQDGGQRGTLVRCRECSGDGLLLQLDPEEMERMRAATPEPSGDTGPAPAANEEFGTTCVECGEAITDERPSVGETPDGPVHGGCTDPAVTACTAATFEGAGCCGEVVDGQCSEQDDHHPTPGMIPYDGPGSGVTGQPTADVAVVRAWSREWPPGPAKALARVLSGVGHTPDVTALELDDFTAAIAAADLSWSAEAGDPPSEPDYIRALAAGARRALLGVSSSTPTSEENDDRGASGGHRS